ncbi:hypothetical protein AMTR_s00242p00009710 [Amborella trichopoda]|uniref:Uncharacterized protein n=1 Tax=Amborella trichopoda TaxID=13333 RepID=W1NPT2_AMBTC|nr:hypothetical protein AMTR_s00242p00009710 [Amborella trichopoda]
MDHEPLWSINSLVDHYFPLTPDGPISPVGHYFQWFINSSGPLLQQTINTSSPSTKWFVTPLVAILQWLQSSVMNNHPQWITTSNCPSTPVIGHYPQQVTTPCDTDTL